VNEGPAGVATEFAEEPDAESELRAAVHSDLYAEEKPEAYGPIGVVAIELPGDPQERWAAFTRGSAAQLPAGYEPRCHFVAIYAPAGDSWEELVREPLCDHAYPEASLVSADLLPEWGEGEYWFDVGGLAGANGGTYELVRFNGSVVEHLLLYDSTVSGRAGAVQDLDGDGVGEVVLNGWDLYAWGNPRPGFELFYSLVYRWVGRELTLVALESLPADFPADLREAVERAVELGLADLWQDAYEAIQEAQALPGGDDERIRWMALHTERTLEARECMDRCAYPFNTNVSAGEYQRAIDALRSADISAIFGPNSVVRARSIVSEEIQSNADVHGEALVDFSSRAIEVRPELAPAYFVRAIGNYLIGPENLDAVIADVREALRLAPDDSLYAESLEYLTELAGG
jgi:hypothetical protein